MSLKQIRSGVMACAAVVLLSGATAVLSSTAGAQMAPSGAQQQQPNPGATAPGNPNGPNGMPTDGMQQNGNALQDKDFVHTALQGGMAEVQLGQLAAEKGSSPDVKQFGQKMVDEHTKLGDQMKQVAQQIGVNAPKELSKKDRELAAKLQGLSGQQFDNAYITAMVKDHKKDAQEFQSEAAQTQNPALKQVAQQGDQVIDQHLRMIEQIAKSHNLMNGKGKLVSGE
jgi:putative membrane protein